MVPPPAEATLWEKCNEGVQRYSSLKSKLLQVITRWPGKLSSIILWRLDRVNLRL